MSTRFFASVRRNQKQWMVVITVLAVFSFLFLDFLSGRRGEVSPFGGGIVIGALCAAGMCIVGYSRQMTAEFGIGGFLVGFVFGFVGFGASGGNRPIVQTGTASFTRAQLNEIANQRSKLNQFVLAVSRKTQNGPQQFGGIDDRSIIRHLLMVEDAQRLAVQVSDDAANEYLKTLMQGKLTKDEFLDCLREAHLSEDELFELLKAELSVNLAFELTRPPSYTPPFPAQFQQFAQQFQQMREPMHYMQPTPHQLWGSFQKLTVKQSLQAVAIPVREFKSKIDGPSETEINDFYEKYKNQFAVDDSQPGFLQEARVQLAYLTADFEKFEKGLDPTDADVAEYYEKHKDRYRLRMPESTAPALPDSALDQPKTEEDSKKEPGDADEKVEPTADGDKKPAEEDIKGEATEKGKDEVNGDAGEKPSEEPKAKCGEDESPADKSDAKTDESKSEPVKDQPPEAPPAAKVEEPANATDPANAEKPKSNDSESNDPENKPAPKLNDSPEALPPVKYRELDEELSAEIREAIMKDRAFLKMASTLDKAKDVMVHHGLEYDTVTDTDQREAKAKLIAEQLKEYADKNKLEYHETAVLTHEELSTQSIGMAFESRGQIPVSSEVFMPGSNGEPRLPKYAPRRADLPSHTGSFAYWKIAEFPAKPADLKDEAVREKVVSAWKFDQARSLAEKRANDLAEKVKSSANNLPAALSGETVVGDKDKPSDPPVSVIEVDPFSWLTTNQSVPNASRGPSISTIPLIPKIGNDFMADVFEKIGNGETGVTVDATRSTFYVVKVIDRGGIKDDDGGVAKGEQQQKFMKEEFASSLYPLTKSPYQILAQIPQRQLEEMWVQLNQKRHNVNWTENSNDETPQPSRTRPVGRKRR